MDRYKVVSLPIKTYLVIDTKLKDYKGKDRIVFNSLSRARAYAKAGRLNKNEEGN